MPQVNVPWLSWAGGNETGTATTCATLPASSASSHSLRPLAERDETSFFSPGAPASQKSKMPWLPGFLPVEIDIHPRELYGGRHDWRRPWRPAARACARLGITPRSASGRSRSQVAPSRPRTTALPDRSEDIGRELYRLCAARIAGRDRLSGGARGGGRRIQSCR